MDGELCRMCGGDGRVGNALGGSTATCPSCVSPILPEDAKTRLLAEIINHESTHERCTKTFLKKIRKQTRPAQ